MRENDTKGDWAARVFFQPFLNSDNFALRGLGFGVGATYVDSTGSPTTTLLTAYRTPGQQSFFSYRSSALATRDDACHHERHVRRRRAAAHVAAVLLLRRPVRPAR